MGLYADQVHIMKWALQRHPPAHIGAHCTINVFDSTHTGIDQVTSFTKHRVRDAIGNEPSDLLSEYGWFFAPSRRESGDIFDAFPRCRTTGHNFQKPFDVSWVIPVDGQNALRVLRILLKERNRYSRRIGRQNAIC